MDHINSKKKHIFVIPNQEHIDHIIQLEDEKIPLIYNTLMFKRMVSVDENIGAFDLARWKWSEHEDFIKEHWFHWEYYAMGSPLWLERLNKCGGKINQERKKIEFDSEDDEEQFYSLYAYELDELPKEVQNMSMKPLLKTNGAVWIDYVFADACYADACYANANACYAFANMSFIY